MHNSWPSYLLTLCQMFKFKCAVGTFHVTTAILQQSFVYSFPVPRSAQHEAGQWPGQCVYTGRYDLCVFAKFGTLRCGTILGIGQFDH